MKKILLAVLVCCLLPLPALARQTLSLEQAVELALRNNPGVEAKLLLLEQARMNVGVAQSYFWPRVSLISSYNRVSNFDEQQAYSVDDLSARTWNSGARLSLSLFAGFSHLNGLQKSRIAVEVEKARHQQARHELACNVQLQFLQLLKLREDRKSADKAVERIKTQLHAAEQFVKVGMAPYANVLQNKSELLRAEQQVIRVKNDIRNAEVQLAEYLGLKDGQEVDYKGNLADYGTAVAYSELEAITAALKYRPDLVIAKKTIQMAYKDMNIRLGDYLPRVDATLDSMQYSRDYDEKRFADYTRRYWAAGISFSWEVFSGGQTTFAGLAEKKRAESLQKDFEDAVAGARTDVIRALLDISAARELIQTTRAGIAAAQENYEMASKRYMTSVGTITELMDAQLTLSQAETDASEALREFQSARARFFYYIGKINASLR